MLVQSAFENFTDVTKEMVRSLLETNPLHRITSLGLKEYISKNKTEMCRENILVNTQACFKAQTEKKERDRLD
jgi:hypothetical protein